MSCIYYTSIINQYCTKPHIFVNKYIQVNENSCPQRNQITNELRAFWSILFLETHYLISLATISPYWWHSIDEYFMKGFFLSFQLIDERLNISNFFSNYYTWRLFSRVLLFFITHFDRFLSKNTKWQIFTNWIVRKAWQI